jgi:hypothetical protein
MILEHLCYRVVFAYIAQLLPDIVQDIARNNRLENSMNQFDIWSNPCIPALHIGKIIQLNKKKKQYFSKKFNNVNNVNL